MLPRILFAWQHSGIQQTFNPPYGSPEDVRFLRGKRTELLVLFYKDDDARALLAGIAVSSL